MNRLSWFGALVLGTCAMTVPCPNAVGAGTHPHTRDGWLAGVGVGGGSSGISVRGIDTRREGGVAASLRVGYAFSPRVSLELDGTGWSKEQQGTTVTFTTTCAGLNFYPGERGLVLRGGIGLGRGEAKQQFDSLTVRGAERGLGLMAGLGYEFRLTPRFALGPQIHGAWINLDSFNANWINLELGFNWYFIPR